jgi:hypothetical protein
MHKHATRVMAGVGAAALGLTIGVGAALAAGPHGSATAPAVGSGGSGPAYGGGYGAGYAGGAGSVTLGQTRTQAITAALALPGGALTAGQAEQLAGMAEEEKLALDLYTAFSHSYDTPVWRNIAASEAAHLEAVRTLLARYGTADPTAGRSAGDFASLEVTSLYRSLLAQGSASESAAWSVGTTVETDDIGRLDAAASGVTAPDVAAVYASLRSASEQHLAAFTRLLAR